MAGRDRRAFLSRRAAATAVDPIPTDVGYHWAVLHVNVQYLGWAAQHLNTDQVAGMLDRAEAALMRLGDALDIAEARA